MDNKDLAKLSQDFEGIIKGCDSLKALEEVKRAFLGKSSLITQFLKDLPEIEDIEERKNYGQKINEIKEYIKNRIIENEKSILNLDKNKTLREEKIDPAINIKKVYLGKLHPITQVLHEVTHLFTSLGFEICEGPDIETDYYNFEALNVPAKHPSRSLADTFYLKNGKLLRTHTSPVQVRSMKKRKPPLRIVAPGRCYRYEAVDATHLAIFNQLEGLYIDKGVRISDLKGVLFEVIKLIFGSSTNVRFRPAYYPFVEPGLDLDIECIYCKGAGCPICKRQGWIELIPCGMVHPNVLKNVGYDNEVFNGFAFGIGFDRLVMLKFGLNNLLSLYSGNLEILEQF